VIPLLLGGVTLVALMMALGMFSGARVTTVKKFGVWVVALGGILLAALLFLTGRGAAGLADLLMLGMVIWPWLKMPRRQPQGGRPGAGPGSGPRPGATGRSGMTRDEAYAVLGLKRGADESMIRDAHRRLMRMAHPDNGGSDWLASRLNQARDTLLI
jgi:hypothetical protein